MRVLLTWELGLNLGHLTRLLPVAKQLKSAGHVVLIAARDIEAAAFVLGPAGIPFILAPHLPKGIPLAHRASGYADILLSLGWSDRSALWGLTQSWLNIFQLYKPDHLILDYSPTVTLAARIVGIPVLLIGNGFELPPVTNPLPPFPGFSWATPERAELAEKRAVANANGVINAFKGEPVSSLCSLVVNETRLLATFPELDHYGERADVEYVGPLLGRINAPRIDWPPCDGPKIFACLRPDTSEVKNILGSLVNMRARIVCVATGFSRAQLNAYDTPRIRYSMKPLDLQPLLDAHLCITYGAEGTMMRFLAAGVPQLIAPWHVETYMAARRIVAAGLGGILKLTQNATATAREIEAVCEGARWKERTSVFAARHTLALGPNACATRLDFLSPSSPFRSAVNNSNADALHVNRAVA